MDIIKTIHMMPKNTKTRPAVTPVRNEYNPSKADVEPIVNSVPRINRAAIPKVDMKISPLAHSGPVVGQ